MMRGSCILYTEVSGSTSASVDIFAASDLQRYPYEIVQKPAITGIRVRAVCERPELEFLPEQT